MLPLIAALAVGQSGTVVLQRGLEVKPLTGAAPFTYWSVEDTTLDAEQADTPQGAASTLESGPGKVILIDFRDLPRVLGPNMKVDSATLTLGLVKGEPKLKGVDLISKPWTEGPLNTIGGILRGKTDPGIWAATYKSRRYAADPILWERPGASGSADSEAYEGATITKEGELTYRIDGLAAAIQKRIDRPFDCYGLALRFESKVQFLSGNATIERPRLTITASPSDAKKGPDLAVTMIERNPEYPRYMPGEPAGTKHWPAEGEDVTYNVHVKNLGDERAEAFDAQWIVRDSQSQIVSSQEKLAPGQETTLQIKLPFKSNNTDHRTAPVGFKLFTKGPDARRTNNRLDIAQCGLAVEMVVPKSIYDEIAGQANLEGTKSFEGWAQSLFDFINDTYFQYSRSSVAPNGILERLRLQKVTIADAPTANPNVDVQLFIGSKPEQLGPDLNLIRETAHQLGLVSLVPVGIPDRFPGLLGYGDTRADLTIPPTIPVPSDPDYSPLYDQEALEPTGMFSMTEAAALMANLGQRRGISGDYLYDVPGSMMLDLRDRTGQPLMGATVNVVQVTDGVEGPSLYQGTLKGVAVLVPPQAATPVTTPTGHSLKSNPFGNIDPTGKNGLLRVKIEQFGVQRTIELKLWQVIDAYHRGQKAIMIHQVWLNVPGKPVAGVNLAEGKAPSVDGDAIEIDLGKDVTLGRVSLAIPDAKLWSSYDITLHDPGEEKDKARLFYRELDSAWRIANQSKNGAIDYYGPPVKGRILRIEKRRAAADTRIGPVKVYAVQ